MTEPNPSKRRAGKFEMEVRRARIFAWVIAGTPYDEIAAMVNLSRDRVRKIVAETFHRREGDRDVDRRLLNEARLEPAMRLAAKAVVEGKLEGVDRLVKVIKELGRIGQNAPKPVYDDDARARLMAKLNLNLRRVEADIARKEARSRRPASD